MYIVGSKRHFDQVRGPPRDIYDAYMHEGTIAAPPGKYAISEINVNPYRCVAQLVRTFASHPCFLFLAPAVNRGGQTPLDLLQSYNTSSLSTRLQITAPIGLTQGYLTRLFSLIPGLEYCDLNETTGKSFIITIPTGHLSVLKLINAVREVKVNKLRGV